MKNNKGFFNPLQDGEGEQKGPPTSFSPVVSTNVETSPRNFLTFSFNPFATLAYNFKASPSTSASPILWNLNQEHLSKKLALLAKSL